MDFLNRFWALITDNSYTVKRASALLAFSAILSNVLGLIRNLVFYWLVPKPQLDVYLASFTIPNLLFNIIIFGAVSSAFVPIASELLAAHKETETFELTNQLLTWLTVLFVGISVVLIIFMSPFMHLVANRFDPTRLNESIGISRILMLQSIFFAWSFTVGGFLNSTKRFSSYAMAPLVYNLTIIVGGVLAVKYGIAAIAWSVVVGSVGHFAIQFREMLKTDYRPKWDFRLTERVKEMGKIMIPRSVSQGSAQLVDAVYTFLGAGLVPSSITIFNAMNDIQTMPIQIVGNSISVAAFPTLSTSAANQEWDKANALLHKSFRTTLFVLIPMLVFVFIVRAQVVRLYLGIGHSSWEQTTLGIDTLVAFLFGIIPACFIAIMSRVFYALKDTRTPMILSSIAAAFAIAYAWIAISLGGNVVSLGIAESILMGTQCMLYAYALYKNTCIRLQVRSLIGPCIHYCVSALILAVTTWATLHLVGWLYDVTHLLSTTKVFGLFIQLVLATAVGVATFLAYSKNVHKEEMQWILRRNFSSEK